MFFTDHRGLINCKIKYQVYKIHITDKTLRIQLTIYIKRLNICTYGIYVHMNYKNKRYNINYNNGSDNLDFYNEDLYISN